jgi:hypothetical protein
MTSNYPELRVVRSLFGTGHDDYGWKHGALGSEAREYVDDVFLASEGEFFVRYEEGHEVYRVEQDDPEFVGKDAEGDIYVKNRVEPVTDSTLLVVVNRNPLKWLQSLHRQPHHAPTHYGLSMAEFIRSPWRTCYTSPNADFSPDEHERQRWVDKSMRLGEVVIEDETSVFMHRARSVMRFEMLQDQVPNVVYFNYEHIRNNPQTALGRLAMQFDIRSNYTYTDSTTYKGNGNKPFIEQAYPPIAKPDLLLIMRSIDWDVERTIGYSPIRDYTLVTDPEEIPDEACENPTNLVVFHPQMRAYSQQKAA